MLHLPSLAACVLATCIAGAARADVPNPLLGDWARTRTGCVRPELSFAAVTVVIRLDADGTPVLFRYPTVTYRLGDGSVTADMGRRHPLARTPDKFALHFVISAPEHAVLQLRNGKTLSYTRCTPDKHP